MRYISPFWWFHFLIGSFFGLIGGFGIFGLVTITVSGIQSQLSGYLVSLVAFGLFIFVASQRAFLITTYDQGLRVAYIFRFPRTVPWSAIDLVRVGGSRGIFLGIFGGNMCWASLQVWYMPKPTNGVEKIAKIIADAAQLTYCTRTIFGKPTYSREPRT